MHTPENVYVLPPFLFHLLVLLLSWTKHPFLLSYELNSMRNILHTYQWSYGGE